HFSVSLDLFGSEQSTNAASYYAAGVKGRFNEADFDDDHVLSDIEASYGAIDDGDLVRHTLPARNLVNLALRDGYVADCAKGVRRWNRVLADHGVDFELRLPHEGFHREVGAFAGHHVSPDGRVIGEAEWDTSVDEWLPTAADRDHLASLMVARHEPGRVAGWIAPPTSGINTKPVDFEYVRL
ncbi:MAG: benzoyl-CoA 2,3-epoxidase subunit BoxB, partial [Acidimicrobiales bacterium]